MNTRILDAHVHLPSGRIPDAQFCGFAEMESAVAYAREAGVSGMVFNFWDALHARTSAELDAGNERALTVYERNRSFFYPGVAIDAGCPECSVRWIREFARRGLRWCGEVLPKGRLDYTAPEWLKLFEVCEENRLIVQLHMSPSVATLARRLSGLTIVHSHIDVATLPALAECPNVFLDFSGFSGLRLGGLETSLKALGPDRILFGSDFTVYSPAFFLDRLQEAVADEREREMILSGNLLHLLERAGGRQPFQEGQDHVGDESDG